MVNKYTIFPEEAPIIEGLNVNRPIRLCTFILLSHWDNILEQYGSDVLNHILKYYAENEEFEKCADIKKALS